MRLSLIVALLCLMSYVLGGVTNEKGYMERVMLILIKKKLLEEDSKIDLLNDYKNIGEFRDAVKKYVIQIDTEGNIIGSNLNYVKDGTDALKFDKEPGKDKDKIKVTNLFGDEVECVYNPDETNDIMRRMESDDTTTRNARKTMKDFMENNKEIDLGIGNDEKGKIFNNNLAEGEMDNNYYKGLVRLSNDLNDVKLLPNNVKDFSKQLSNLRAEYNVKLIERYNELMKQTEEYFKGVTTDMTTGEQKFPAIKEIKGNKEMMDVFNQYKLFPKNTAGEIDEEKPVKVALINKQFREMKVRDHVVIRSILSNYEHIGSTNYNTGVDFKDFDKTIDPEPKINNGVLNKEEIEITNSKGEKVKKNIFKFTSCSDI